MSASPKIMMLVRFSARALLAACMACQITWSTTAQAMTLLPPSASAGVLGLDGADEAATHALTEALRHEFARKGRGSEVTTTLAELRLMSGCSGDDAACIARAGRALKSEILIFGHLSAHDTGLRLVLSAVESASTNLLNRRTFDFAYDSLAPDRIAATASLIVSIFNDDVDSQEAAIPVELTIEKVNPTTPGPAAPGTHVPLPSAAPEPTIDDEPVESPHVSLREPDNVPHYPIGAMVGTLVAGGLTIGASIWALKTYSLLQDSGEVRQDLLAAAAASLQDENPNNDVPPGSDGNLCTAAREMIEGGARNPEMIRICNRGERLTKSNHWAGRATIGLGIVTAGLATLWIIKAVQRKKKMQALAKPYALPNVVWQPGGAQIGVTLRF